MSKKGKQASEKTQEKGVAVIPDVSPDEPLYPSVEAGRGSAIEHYDSLAGSGVHPTTKQSGSITIQIDLTPEQESRLTELAQQEGLSAQEYMRQRVLIDLVQDLTDFEHPMTGAEARAYWKQIGALGLLADRPDSPEYARELRRQAETRDLGG